MGINLFMINPQSIIVRRGLENRMDPIELQISNIIPMLMAHLRNPGSFSFMSGIDRFFLAPELSHYDTGTYNDIWSIGSIIYMLVTGGYGNKQSARAFEFNEEIWKEVSPELRAFLGKCLVLEAHNRAGIDELLACEFIQKAAALCIPGGEPFGTRCSSAGYNLYQFQWAHCFNMIICKHMENEEKLDKI